MIRQFYESELVGISFSISKMLGRRARMPSPDVLILIEDVLHPPGQ